MPRPIQRILVYIDGSEQSVAAAQYSIVLAKSFAAELYALYVIDTRSLSELVRAKIFLLSEQEEYKNDLAEDATRYLKHVQDLAQKKGVKVTVESSSGSIHSEIKNKINEHKIDLLVIGEISQIRSRRDELYNDTERAMRTVPCPVLIAKGEDKIWDLYESTE